MTYPISFRRKVLAHIKEGMNKRDAARLFKVSPQTLYNWLQRDNLSPKPHGFRRRKLDKNKLRAHVRQEPEMLLRERAKIFNISVPGLSIALKTMKIVKKKNANIWNETL